jgi:hypothetical protein
MLLQIAVSSERRIFLCLRNYIPQRPSSSPSSYFHKQMSLLAFFIGPCTERTRVHPLSIFITGTGRIVNLFAILFNAERRMTYNRSCMNSSVNFLYWQTRLLCTVTVKMRHRYGTTTKINSAMCAGVIPTLPPCPVNGFITSRNHFHNAVGSNVVT